MDDAMKRRWLGILENLEAMILKKWNKEMLAINFTMANHDGYLRGCELYHDSPEVVCTVSFSGGELIRYPFMDVEFLIQPDKEKVGMTGKRYSVLRLLQDMEEASTSKEQ